MKKTIALIFACGALATSAFAQRPAASPEQQAAQKAAADATQADRNDMMKQLGITTMRPPKNGSDSTAANFTNYDESKANIYPNLPEVLTFNDGKKVTKAAEWPKRRAEIVELFDREIYGRMPKNVPKVTWRVYKDSDQVVNNIPVNVKQLVGHVDNSSYPAINVDIQLTLTVPKSASKAVPVIMVYGGQDFLAPRPAGGFGGGFGPPRAGAPGAGPAPKSAQQQILEKGWAYASLNPGTIQADNGAGLTKGIIGLVNKGQFRKPDDWGALRAWAWGADRAIDYFESNKAVDAKKVAIEGHSRYGKGAIVALAYNPRMATAYVSSSGQGGAKILRRNFGEVVENVTASSEYHWMAGNFLKYGSTLQWSDLPIDAHELIALCAPRPVFISGGKVAKVNMDGWVDAPGMFMAANAAGPVYTLLGKKPMETKVFPKIETMVDGDVAFRQHAAGHTDGPNWPYFLTWADKYFK
ncbi:acetylxylan esterase [Mucilaginibacter calamicampi]|uniref:Acetylxylan esterase n=1 Tax=Mucilaginibacter calamicampi TaxID=1302352 RepID=A0ABW2Z222_9SPHI